jgi:hypothetical protein
MGVVTGIGSLPFNDPLEAVDFVATFCPHLPFCPQPPSADLAEDTLAQQLDSSPRGWAWSLDHFVDAALAGAFPHALALKTQVTGPITLAGLLGATGQATVSAKLLAALANWVIDHVSWQLDRLRAAGRPVLVFLDEPALALLGPSDVAKARALLVPVLDRVRSLGGLTGIHCCATTAPGLLGSFGADAISYDASTAAVPKLHDETVLSDQRRVISFGLTGAAPRSEPAGVAFSRWLVAAAFEGDPQRLARRTIVTTRCGLGRSTVPEAEAAFDRTAVVSGLVTEVARAPGNGEGARPRAPEDRRAG